MVSLDALISWKGFFTVFRINSFLTVKLGWFSRIWLGSLKFFLTLNSFKFASMISQLEILFDFTFHLSLVILNIVPFRKNLLCDFLIFIFDGLSLLLFVVPVGPRQVFILIICKLTTIWTCVPYLLKQQSIWFLSSQISLWFLKRPRSVFR